MKKLFLKFFDLVHFHNYGHIGNCFYYIEIERETLKEQDKFIKELLICFRDLPI